jgi:transposase-like protein
MSNSKKGNRYSEDFKKQLYELNLNGKSVPTLASEYGIPTGTIYNINGFQS